MASITSLKTQLEKAITTNVMVLPKPSVVTEVDVTSFLTDVLKCPKDISIEEAKVTLSSDSKTVEVTGKWKVFGVTQSITWSFTDEGQGNGITWTFASATQDIGNLNAITKYFLQEDAPIPNKITSLTDLEVKEIKISTSINTTTNNYSLQLSADTDKGALALAVQDDNGTFGAAAGLKLHAQIKPSDILDALSVFDILQLNDPAVIISSIDNDGLEIVGIDGVKKGITLTAGLELVENTDGSALAKIENELSKGMQNVPMQMYINLNQDALSLRAQIEKEFSLPGFDKLTLSKVGFEVDTSPKASLDGILTVPIKIPANPDLENIKVKGAVFFSYDIPTATGDIGGSLYWGQGLGPDQVLKDPFGFKGVTIKEFGVGMDLHFGAQNGVGFIVQGDYAIGENPSPPEAKFAIAVEINAETEGIPNPVLLHFKYNNLSLPKIFEACYQGTNIHLPEELNDIEFRQLEMYWCEKDQNLPDGSKATKGIGYNAGLNLFNFDSYSELKMNFEEGVKGDCMIDPINLWDGKIKVTGRSEGNEKFHIEPGGAFFDFDTSKVVFDASLDANILGMEQVVDAHIGTDGIDITIKTDLDFFENDLSVRFHGLTDMGFSETIKMDLNATPKFVKKGLNLGNFHLDTALLNGHIEFSIKEGINVTAIASGNFKWMDEEISFSFDVSPYLDKMEDLAKAVATMIENKAQEIFDDFFSHVTNYLKAWVEGALEGGAFVLNVLHTVYGYTVEQIVEFIQTLQDGVHLNGNLDFDLKYSVDVASKSFHADLGTLIDDHWDKFIVDKHADVNASMDIKTPGFKVDLINFGAHEHFDMVMPPSVHADAGTHIDESEHLDFGPAGGSFAVNGKVGVDTMVSLKDLHFDAKVNVNESAGVHVDILKVVDINPKVSGHIDQA